VRLNQIKQRFQQHHLVHRALKSLAACALLVGGLLVITKTELLAAHEPRPCLRLHGHFRADGIGFAESL
jgi:hypothetical protein